MTDAPTTRAEKITRLLECTPVRLSLFFTLVVFSLSPIFVSPRHGGFTLDWQFFQFFDEIARKSILQFHQFPIWNPYFCGGTTLVGNPQTTYLVPTFPLVLIFGTTFGERLSNIPVLLLGCEGGYRLMRYLDVRPWPSLFAAFAIPFFARTFAWIHDGQHGLVGMALATWVLYGYLRGLEKPIYLALGAFFFSWFVCFRGIESAPQIALALVLWAMLEARRRWLTRPTWRSVLWPLAAVGILGLLTLGYAGLRMVPVLEVVLGHPRIINETIWNRLSWVFTEIYAIPPATHGWEAPGYAYVGLVTYLFFVGAVLFARARRRAAIPLLLALLCMLLSMGMHGTFSPLPILRHLPLFKSLRQPALWSFAGAFFIVISACFAADELDRWLGEKGRRGARIAAVLLPLLALGTGIELSYRGQWSLGPHSPPFTWAPATRVEQDFKQTRGNHFEHAMFPPLDRGTLSCYDETPWPASAALRPDLPAEEYLADPTAGTVTRTKWTPNRIDLDVDLARPATVLVNQNYVSGWSASSGKVHSAGGIVGVDLPAGKTHLTLTIWPTACTYGLLLMLLALGATYWMWRRRDAHAAYVG